MAKVSIQTITVAVDHAPNYGTACKQMCTQIAEAMGLSLVTVITDSTSKYSAYYCYNNDLRFQVVLFNSSSGLYYELGRQDSSGKISSITSEQFAYIGYDSASTYYSSFRLVTAGTLKYIRYLTNSSNYYGFGFATMMNVYDAKTHPIILRATSDTLYPSLDVYTMLDDYSVITLSRYKMSDTSIPYDGKFYLVPIRFGSLTYNIMGSPGEVSYYELMGTSMFGSTMGVNYLPSGTLLSIGGTSVVYIWLYIFIGLE